MCIPEKEWPPDPQDLHASYIQLPDALKRLLSVMLCGEHSSSARIGRVSWSIAQDIIYAITRGKILTAKHVLLPSVVKTLTGNVELIQILNKMGHSCSYTSLEEIDTALCLSKLEKFDTDDTPLPSNTHPFIPTVLAFDNIDRQEEVLSGAGTSHRVNGIIVQPPTMTCAPPPKTIAPTDKRQRRRTIQPTDQALPVYITGKRVGPPPVIRADVAMHIAPSAVTARQRNFMWVLVRQHDVDVNITSSWTGFNITTRDDISVTSDTVGYLPTINAPATEMSTVQEILHQSLNIQQSLNLPAIAVVLDQALYSKASEIAWKYVEEYKSIVLLMGNFHIICNFMSTIGKMFGDAGLRDMAVESGVIAEGSINKVLEGKQYNRAVRFHKLTYEALMRLAWAGFSDWLEAKHHDDLTHLNHTLSECFELHQNTCSATLTSAMENESCKRIFELFVEYQKLLMNQRGPLSALWMTYIQMVETLLGLLRADREGDWQLHLHCIREIIPWCFAMDKTNYARYLPVYYAHIENLHKTNPDLYEHFERGGFTVQRSDTNPFGRIAVDQTTEETVNKDTQTAGGTRGFSLKPGTVSRYYLTAEYRASALRQMREHVATSSRVFSHADLGASRISKDESDVSSITDLLENNWTNPFLPDSQDMVSISTGTVAPPNVVHDLITAHQQGEIAYREFQERLEMGNGFYEPIKKLQLKTFGSMKQKGTTKEVVLKADRILFGNMILIAQNRKLEMGEVLCYPLGPLPWSLANADGTMKKTNKAVLAKQLESRVSPTNDYPDQCATLVDAMGLIHKIHGDNQTFSELANHVLTQVLHDGHRSNRIDVVFDVYKKDSIKSAERVSRGSAESIAFSQIRPGHKIKNWRRLLASTESKSQLTQFLAESWKTPETRGQLGTKTLYVTCGNKCLKLTKDSAEEVDALASGQEEADTRILLHAKHASRDYHSLLCVCDDTDVFIICLGLSKYIEGRIFIRRGTKTRMRLIDVTLLASALGSDTCLALMGLHAWTGCDTVSALAGQGKIKALNIILKHPKFRKAFEMLGKDWDLPQQVFCDIQEFACKLYCSTTRTSVVNELRYNMFRNRKGDVESGQLPPCEDTLKQHTRRANYQTAIWRKSLENSPDIPDPTAGHGWIKDENGSLVIEWMTSTPAPEAVIGLLSCKCSRTCKADCTCIMNGLRCTAACKLVTCSNMHVADEDDDIHQDDDDDTSDIDDS